MVNRTKWICGCVPGSKIKLVVLLWEKFLYFFFVMIADQENTIAQGDDVVRVPNSFSGGFIKLLCLLLCFHIECFDNCS